MHDYRPPLSIWSPASMDAYNGVIHQSTWHPWWVWAATNCMENIQSSRTQLIMASRWPTWYLQLLSNVACTLMTMLIHSGLIYYKMVIHCFIDGDTQLVTGIQVNNNNHADTVLALLLNTTQTHRIP